jgi:hypothetical protein
VAEADPDINMPYVFMLGNEMSKKWGQKQRVGKVRFPLASAPYACACPDRIGVWGLGLRVQGHVRHIHAYVTIEQG